MAVKKATKFPKSLAVCADRYYELRQQRLKLQKEVDAIAAEESAYKNHLIDNVPKSEATGVQGKVARATIVTKEEPQVEDQTKFRQYMNRTKRFDLATKLRPSAPAIRELWEDGKDVPGIKKFTVVTVSLNKV
jgi:uncharacterized coiled-coil DUF342 family protein